MLASPRKSIGELKARFGVSTPGLYRIRKEALKNQQPAAA